MKQTVKTVGVELLPRVLGVVALCLFALGGMTWPMHVEKTRDSILYLSFLLMVPPVVYLYLRWLKKPAPWVEYLILAIAVFMGSPRAKLGAALLCMVQLFFEQDHPWAWRPKWPRDWGARVRQVPWLTSFQLWAIWVINGELVFQTQNRFAGRAFDSWLCLGLAVLAVGVWTRVPFGVEPPRKIPTDRRLLFLVPLVVGFPLLWATPYGTAYSHHWDFYVGPVQLLREGGRLLHDVPSQYGFLNILILQFMSGLGLYRGFFLTLVFIYSATAIVLAGLLSFSFGRSRWGAILAGALTVGVLWTNPDWQVDSPGSALSFPSTGPFRFAWVIALLAVVVWMTDGKSKGSAPRRLSFFSYLPGTLIWVVSCLWSVESAIYASMTWLPSFAVFLWMDRRLSFKRLATPVLLLLLVALGIGVEYRHAIGFWPDVRAYFEYALVYAGGYATVGADRNGPVWVAILLEVMILIVGVKLIAEKKREHLPVCLAAFFGLWSTGSYYAARSHANNLINLLPIIAECWGLVIYTVRSAWPSELRRAWHFAVPFMVVAMMLALGDSQFPRVYARDWQAMREERSDPALMATRTRDRDPVLSLIQEGGLTAEDPLVFFYPCLPSIGSKLGRPWLPMAPYLEYAILPEARRRKYLGRWMARGLAGNGGYILYEAPTLSEVPEVWEVLASFKKVRRLENGGWILEKYLVHE